jgi:multiple sugar transport system permease protein
MSKTPMIIIGASIFMGYYNSYIWPTLIIDQKHKGLFQMMTVIYSLFADAGDIGYGSVLAAAFIAMIPPLVIFIVMQKHIKDGIQLTGVK